MSDVPSGGPGGADADMDGFYRTADRYLDTANALMGAETPARIGAAFMYGCARFSAFALQAQFEDAAQRREDLWDGLCDAFEGELRDHMLQRLRNALETGQGTATGEALDVLVSLNGMDERARSVFLRLCDNFVRVANDLIAEDGVARASAAFLHACTRFNAYLLQREGLEAGVVDEALVTDFRQVFADLLRFHMDQTLIVPDGT